MKLSQAYLDGLISSVELIEAVQNPTAIKKLEDKIKGKPVSGKTYRLTGGSKEKCISNGNTWAESEVKKS